MILYHMDEHAPIYFIIDIHNLVSIVASLVTYVSLPTYIPSRLSVEDRRDDEVEEV